MLTKLLVFLIFYLLDIVFKTLKRFLRLINFILQDGAQVSNLLKHLEVGTLHVLRFSLLGLLNLISIDLLSQGSC